MKNVELINFKLIGVKYELINGKSENTIDINIHTPKLNEDNINNVLTGVADITINDAGVLNNEDSYRVINIVIHGLFKIKENNCSIEELETIFREEVGNLLIPYLRTLVSQLTSFDSTTQHLLLPLIEME